MKKLWERIVRLRTWLVNLMLVIIAITPDLLNSPEIIAIIPPDYVRRVLAAAAVINILMRPRPAVIKTDLEASVSRSRRRAGETWT